MWIYLQRTQLCTRQNLAHLVCFRMADFRSASFSCCLLMEAIVRTLSRWLVPRTCFPSPLSTMTTQAINPPIFAGNTAVGERKEGDPDTVLWIAIISLMFWKLPAPQRKTILPPGRRMRAHSETSRGRNLWSFDDDKHLLPNGKSDMMRSIVPSRIGNRAASQVAKFAAPAEPAVFDTFFTPLRYFVTKRAKLSTRKATSPPIPTQGILLSAASTG